LTQISESRQRALVQVHGFRFLAALARRMKDVGGSISIESGRKYEVLNVPTTIGENRQGVAIVQKKIAYCDPRIKLPYGYVHASPEEIERLICDDSAAIRAAIAWKKSQHSMARVLRIARAINEPTMQPEGESVPSGADAVNNATGERKRALLST